MRHGCGLSHFNPPPPSAEPPLGKGANTSPAASYTLYSLCSHYLNAAALNLPMANSHRRWATTPFHPVAEINFRHGVKWRPPNGRRTSSKPSKVFAARLGVSVWRQACRQTDRSPPAAPCQPHILPLVVLTRSAGSSSSRKSPRPSKEEQGHLSVFKLRLCFHDAVVYRQRVVKDFESSSVKQRV